MSALGLIARVFPVEGTLKLAIAGGVASNTALRELLEKECKKNKISFFRPSPVLCTDNAAMIGAAAYFEYQKGVRFGLDMNAVPNLPLGDRERRYHANKN